MDVAERVRLESLHEYDVLDQPPGDELEAVVRLAAAAVGIPNATLNLIDESRQCQLASVGFAGGVSARGDSMCAVRFLDGRTVWTPDASNHPDYRDNPWVTGTLGKVRFYASAPLITPAGHTLGTLCLFDTETRQLTPAQAGLVSDAAGVVVALFERHRQARVNAELATESGRGRARLAEATRELAERQELTDAVLETADVGIVAADASGRLTLFNRACREWHGIDADNDVHPDEHAERYGLFHPDGVTPLAPAEVPLARVMREGRVTDAEIVIALDGRNATRVTCSGRALTGADGTVLGGVVVMRDITAERARADALAESRQLLDAMFDGSPDPILLSDGHGNVLQANGAWERVLGWTETEMAEMGVRSLLHPDDRAAVEAHVGDVAAFAAGEHREFVTRVRCRNGDYRWLHWNATAVPGQRVAATARDITRERAVAAELRVAEEQQRAAFESSPLAMAVADEDGRFRQVNQAFAVLLGRRADQLVGADWRDFTGPGDVPDQTTDEAETRFLHADGTVVWAAVRLTVVPNADGTGSLLVQAQDITVRREARHRAARETGRLRATIAVQRELTAAATDRDVLLSRVADRTAATFGEGSGAVVALLDDEGSPRAEATTPELKHMLGVRVESPITVTAIATGSTRRGALAGATMAAPLVLADEVVGAITVYAGAGRPFDENDEQQLTLLADAIGGALRHAEDATRKEQLLTQANDALSALAVSESRYRLAATQLAERAQLLDLTQDAVVVRSLDGRIGYWNPAAERVYGWSAQVAAGHDLDRLLDTRWHDGSSRASVTAALKAHGVWEGELEHGRADGTRVTVLSRKALQRDAQGRPVGILSINTDITARRAAEIALGASEQRFRSQFAHSTAGQMIHGIDDTIEDVNPAFAAMLGWTREQLVGGPAGRVYDPSRAGDRLVALASMVTGETDAITAESHLVRRDGTLLDVHLNVSAVRGRDGRPERYVGIYQDITARKTAECERDTAMVDLAAKNTQLEEANRLKLDIIGMLGHEIGNPLSAIVGYTEHALDSWDGMTTVRQREILAVIDRNAQRLDCIVREVLAMVTLDAGKLTAHPEPTSVRARLSAAVAATRETLELDCSDAVTALVQPGHLDQIITNLLSNAAKYGGGATAVRVGRSGEHVRISVEDHGPGVPEAFRGQLFERFARSGATAERIKGTGLGLYIVRELARANRGDVTYRPRPGGGSTFTLRLPAAQVTPAPTPVPAGGAAS